MRNPLTATSYSYCSFWAHGPPIFQTKAERYPKNTQADHVFDLLFPDIKDMRFSSGFGLHASGFSDEDFARKGLDCRVWGLV